MGRDARERVSFVIGPDGTALTFEGLPRPETRRWVARRKAEVVAAVNGGLIGLKEACERYALTVEEFLSWEDAMLRFGMSGLKATEAQRHRLAAQHPPHQRAF